ncbi:hypothetical protein [Sulfurospirillum barnesii]|uniref:Uncharacterized protein n=1 Tax=Sulfurospirillum barnesii (strain ATCC 700032 / DSM 10660 / SES-3) TaxID=760154 RepID=I3XV28_SULBS|nr:hypothetical protein [Sulfurospirillum barnesii]AFL67802.1 hypothetical protein Sulba_0484 [Sulfurospirillum barnesii SES-3]
MSKMKYGIIASVVVAGLLAMPLVVSQKVDATINAKAKVLANNGFKSEQLSKSGYFTTQRTFSLEVVDAKKARDFLLAQLVEKNAQYKLIAQTLTEESESGINEALNGLKFQGEMTHSNLLPSDVKVSMTLSQLPTVVQASLAEDKELSVRVLPLLARGVFGADMLFGSDEALKEFQLKDIKEEMIVDGGTLHVDTKDHTLRLNHRGERVHGSLGVGHQLFSMKGEAFLSKSELKDFMYTFTYKDEFNNKADLKIGSYALAMNDGLSLLHVELGGLKSQSSIEERQKELRMSADYAFEGIGVLSSSDDIKLDKLFLKLDVEGLNAELTHKLQEDYNALVLNPTPPSEKMLISDTIALINHGVKVKFDIALKAFQSTLVKLNDVRVDTVIEIAKNSYSDTQSPLALVGLLDIRSKVKVHKDDRATLEALNLASAKEFALGRAEGDFFVYDLAMKNGVISVNDQAIQ